MIYSWRCRLTFIILIIIISKSNGQARNRYRATPEDNTEGLSADFVNFVKGLDTMVFNREPKKNHTEVKTTKIRPRNTTRRTYRRNSNNAFHQNIKSTQNAALRDVLMLKLVSYYEDKYKVAIEDTTTVRAVDPISHSHNHVTQPTKTSPKGADSIENIAMRRKLATNVQATKLIENTQDYNTLDPNAEDLDQQSGMVGVVVL